jgi:hypothetical protein
VKSLAVLIAVTLAFLLLASVGSAAKAPAWTKNCTALNKRYPHGLGRLAARDKTSGTPVRNFKRSTTLYKLADSFNGRLDGDNDGRRMREGVTGDDCVRAFSTRTTTPKGGYSLSAFAAGTRSRPTPEGALRADSPCELRTIERSETSFRSGESDLLPRPRYSASLRIR